jgi:hypothetical protein
MSQKKGRLDQKPPLRQDGNFSLRKGGLVNDSFPCFPERQTNIGQKKGVPCLDRQNTPFYMDNSLS